MVAQWMDEISRKAMIASSPREKALAAAYLISPTTFDALTDAVPVWAYNYRVHPRTDRRNHLIVARELLDSLLKEAEIP